MKNLFAILPLCLCLIPTLGSSDVVNDWILVDDFSEDPISGWELFYLFELVPTINLVEDPQVPSNQTLYLESRASETFYGDAFLSKALPGGGIPYGSTGTIFWRFLYTGIGNNVVMGSAPGPVEFYPDYSTMLRKFEEGLIQIRDGVTYRETVDRAVMTPNSWYNIWMVIDNSSAPSYQVYLQGPQDPLPYLQVLEDWAGSGQKESYEFRNLPEQGEAITHFVLTSQQSPFVEPILNPHMIDDIYFSLGSQLSNPAAGPDSDNDGLADSLESSLGTNPLLPDTDGDQLTDGEEVTLYLTNPLKADSDDDALDDNVELDLFKTNPLVADSDEDGLKDGEEVLQYLTDPNNPDSDSDTAGDGLEVLTAGTKPLNPDTDGDGVKDGIEITNGKDPLVWDIYAPVLSFEEHFDLFPGDKLIVDAEPVDGHPAVYNYQWYFNGLMIPESLGGKESSYEISGIVENIGTWSVAVSNSAGSAEASFTIGILGEKAPELLLEDTYVIVNGTTMDIDATPVDGYPRDFSYQWYFEDLALPVGKGGTEARLQLSGAHDTQGLWKVVVTNSAGQTEVNFKVLLSHETWLLAMGAENVYAMAPSGLGTFTLNTMPWAWNYNHNRWLYIPEDVSLNGNGWIYLPFIELPDSPAGSGSWGRFPVSQEIFADTGDWFGWLRIDMAPWVWSYTARTWFYFPDQVAEQGQGWVYMP